MSINKLFKHQSEPGAKSNSFDVPVDRSFHNFSQPFNGFMSSRSPQLVSDDLERQRQEQFRQFNDEIKNPSSINFDSSYEDGQIFVQSPTLSQSSNPEFFSRNENREQTIGNMQITNLYESPRRFGTRFCNEQEMELNESSRRPPNPLPRRAPGFPRVNQYCQLGFVININFIILACFVATATRER